MLDEDLADLYGVETKRLIEQVKRNLERFPEDFMFQLDRSEAAALRSQIATSNAGRGGRRYAPYVFTEQGVAMLSGVLRSKRAIAVNIETMRAFVDQSVQSDSGCLRTRNRRLLPSQTCRDPPCPRPQHRSAPACAFAILGA
ncbi:MAG: ORF6N domain-containing protein [Solirubrobacterales bacterium]|nr:ORF6N domain-containing protein [Solirubrobacterales bacterium]